MSFSSVVFLFFFLPVCLALYSLVGRKWRNGVFLLASLVFYLWGEGRYTAVLLLSIAVNYALGFALERPGKVAGHAEAVSSPTPSDDGPASNPTRKRLLVAGLVFNLGLLGFYKYTDFLLANANSLVTWFGGIPFGIDRGPVPTGISFFTFHAISYLVDVYEGRARSERNPTAFALYMAAFPKILAGPIQPYQAGSEQLRDRSLTRAGTASGIERFILGLGKKVLIANPLAGVADQVFGHPSGGLTAEVAWLGLVCYTLQIYFDFSGYTDMAIGLGRMFGFEFPENFNFPYASQSIQEFWRRWHMSLSRWLRDYLYIPLGGNRCSTARHYRNLVTVFVLCGLWHGANWTFIIWGLWYGVFLILERMRFGRALGAAPRLVRHGYALLVVMAGWVFFRSESLARAMEYFVALSGFGPGTSTAITLQTLMDKEIAVALILGTVLSLPTLATLNRIGLARRPSSPSALSALGSVAYGLLLGAVLLLACMALAGGTLKSFIYFRF